MRNCLLNLLDNKVELYNQHAHTIRGNNWPSNIKPNRIRCDYGSEYRSKESERIFNELGITRELVSPGTGSLKGQVEQSFHQMHSSQNALLSGKGLITKRHDSKHHAEATLNIDDFEKMLVVFIVSHNQQYMKNYPLTIEMQNDNVLPIPTKILEYGCTHFGLPKPIGNPHQYMFALLTPITVSLGQKGIIYKGLNYLNNDDPHLTAVLYNAGSKQLKKDYFRMDPTDVSQIYYINSDKCLSFARLNYDRVDNQFSGYTLKEYLLFRKRKQELDKLGAGFETNRKVALLAAQAEVVGSVSRDQNRKKNTTGMVSARRDEKAAKSQDYSIKKHLHSHPETPSDLSQPQQHLPEADIHNAEDLSLDFSTSQINSFLRKAESHGINNAQEG